jgi:ferredoxin
MSIHHDPGRCASTGMCEAVAPQVFRIRPDGSLAILDPRPQGALLGLAAEAVATCPTGALRLDD